MDNLTANATHVLSVLTVGANILTVILFVLVLFFRKSAKGFLGFFSKHALVIAFIIALTAMLGSLFYSEIGGYEPCKLCWYQRIFMYPLAFLFGIAAVKRDKNISVYGLWLGVIGLIIAIYHYYLQLGGNPLVPCGTVGYSVDCSQRFFMTFGYITIPMMALSAFALIIMLMVNLKANKKK